MYNPFSLEKKTILVTGASSGIGKATAIECSRMGAQLIITGRNKERLNDTFCSLEGNNHLQFAGDLKDMDFIEALVKELPSLDGIVHSAGVPMYLPFKFTTREKFDDVFKINFEAVLFLTLGLVKQKKIEKQGSIVFVSSIAGVMSTSVGSALYSASKGAINGFAKGLALDLSKQGIRVNSVVPAMVDTELLSDGILTPEQMEEDAQKYPLKRWGKPEEIAHAIIYFLSDVSKWTTGSNLLIDGGITLI